MTQSAGIGYWTQVAGQKGLDVHVVADIEQEEFDRYLSAIATYRSVTERNVHQHLQRCWERLRSMRALYSNVERIGGSFRVVDRRAISVLFMGEVANWLAATRLYLEAERDSLFRFFGDGSDQAKRFAATTSRVFDSNEGYRFLYNLRDYSQHCGPPLGGFIVSKKDDGSRSVELYLSRSELLLARFDWNRHAKALLKQWDEQILLIPLIEQAMRGFREIENELLAILIERCGDALPTLREGITRSAAQGNGVPAIFKLPEEGEEGQWAWQSFPSVVDLDRVEAAIAAETPVEALRKPRGNPQDQHSPEMRHAAKQAAAVIGVWLEDGPSQHLTDAMNRVIQEDGDITPIISGLVNLSTTLMSMLSISLGTSPQALLGGFVSTDRPDLTDGEGAAS